MPLCTVPGCNKNGVHLFPKNPSLKKQWEIAIRRKNFVATKHSRICRDHFKESDYVGESAYTGYQQQHRFLKQGTVPSVFPWTKVTTPTSRALRYEQRIKKRRLDFSVAQESTSESSCQIPPSANEVEIATSSPPDDTVPSNTKHEASTQTAHSCGILSLNAISNDNNIIHFYTGMETYDKFMLLFDTLSPMCYDLTYRESRVMNVSPQEQLLITMIKLRRNLPDVELAFLFGISSVNVSNIFITWVNFMYEIWSTINIWPNKELVKFYMPEQFKQDFPNTRVIIDTTEIPIMKPSNPISQQATFSNYKHKNTLKAMIGATPGGLISYVSDCYGGSVSDRQIMERSNLDKLCESGDSIMADRGFNVQDLLIPRNVTINIPMFLKGRTQIPGVQVLKDRNLASKRVHIERIIGLAKTYKILKSELSPYFTPLGSRILFVCAMACNFRENIMK